MPSPLDLNLRHLDALLAVDRSGSITAAAEAVNMSQPTLSQAILNLESQLGQELFGRTARGVVTTAPGELFIARVDRAITRIVQGHQFVRASAKLPPLRFPQRSISMIQLRAFLAVEHARSYSAAARALKLKQPSVHRAVGQLESIFGIKLFMRTGRSIRPTELAERFARSVRLALLELRAGLEEIADLQERGAARIAIGALSLPLACFVPKALDSFAHARSGIQINIVQGTHSDLLLQLENGDIDFLVDTYRPEIASRAVHQEVLFADSFRIVASSLHPLAGTKPTIRQLAMYPWLVGPPNSPIREAWNEVFPGEELPTVYIESTSTSAIRSFLQLGNWLAILSPDQFETERNFGTLTCLDGPPIGIQRRVCLTTRSDWKPTRTQQELIGCLKRAAPAAPA